ncbi:MAG: hypothetical protein GF346_12060, partial [Candidatus Eisenbacteria bacterium]|nr:hypothetical protein [Candidatus Latescibacterota bacterium]MBD3303171.1 hypothetical protein [Candidatus Eisenbacteria bacterium]
MNRKINRALGNVALPALLAFALAIVAGCSDDESTKPPDQFAPPTNLTYVNGDEEVDLDWDGTPDETWDTFAGYNVYRHESSLADTPVNDLGDYKIATTQAGTTSYIDRTAENGTMYFYTVRAAED